MFPAPFTPFDAKGQAAFSKIHLHADLAFDAVSGGGTPITYSAAFTVDHDFPRIDWDARYQIGPSVPSNNIPFDNFEKFIVVRYPYYPFIFGASFDNAMPANYDLVIPDANSIVSALEFDHTFSGAYSDSAHDGGAVSCDSGARNLNITANLITVGENLSAGTQMAVWNFHASPSGSLCISGLLGAVGALFGGDTASFSLSAVSLVELLTKQEKIITIANPGGFSTWSATAKYSMQAMA